MRCFVGASLVIHLFIFMHITNLYRSSMLTYIELTLKDISKPPKRSIPRPRLRPKMPEQPSDVNRLKVSQRPIPKFKPMRMAPVEADLPKSLVERISMPDTPNVPGLNISDWNPENLVATEDQAITATSYLEMVRLKIENHKRYPKVAKIMEIEGKVTIRFIITPEGNVRAARVVKTSRHGVLDTTALKAVRDAAPFPKPPRRFFKGEIPLELTVVFELT